MPDKWTEHLRKAGQKGGLAKGQAKVRGDSEYYRTISSLASAARKKKAKGKKK